MMCACCVVASFNVCTSRSFNRPVRLLPRRRDDDDDVVFDFDTVDFDVDDFVLVDDDRGFDLDADDVLDRYDGDNGGFTVEGGFVVDAGVDVDDGTDCGTLADLDECREDDIWKLGWGTKTNCDGSLVTVLTAARPPNTPPMIQLPTVEFDKDVLSPVSTKYLVPFSS
jgi:hypothetical protein